MSEQSKSINVSGKKLVHAAIMLALMFGFKYVPPIGTITPYGMGILGVFLGLIWGWSFLDLLIPTLVGIFGLALAGYGTVDKVALAMMNNSSVFMMLIGSLCFMVLMQSKVADWLMAKILSSPIGKKSPVYTVALILTASVVINSMGGNMIFYFGIFPIMVSILVKVGYPKGDKFSVFFLVGFMATIQLGMCFRPFIGWGLMTVGTMMQLTQSQLSFGAYMLIMFILDAVFVITYVGMMKLVGCDFQRLANVDIVQAFGVDPDSKLDLGQKIVLFAMCLFLIIVIVFSVAGKSLGLLNTYYMQISVAGLMILFWIAMIAIKIDGKPLLNMREASAMYSWDMLFLVALALLISSVLTSQDTGVSAFIGSLLGPIFAGKSPMLFLVFLGVITLFLTNVANNIAICYIMMNITAAMYNNGMPVNILAASMIISIFSVIAFLTPASSMPAAMLHACDALTPSAMYKWVPLILVYFCVISLLVICPAAALFM